MIKDFFAGVFFMANLLLCATGFGQPPVCGSDTYRSDQLTRNWNTPEAENRFRESLYQHLSAKQLHSRNSSVPVVVPVVYHIMHNNGPENISDSLVQASIAELNLRFQNSAPFFDSTGHPINIQFCLATVDPFGYPTNGITRTVTTLTDLDGSPAQDSAMKILMRWPPDMYLNVWTVNSIFGNTAGYASFPYNAGQYWDGIVSEYQYVTNYYLMAHEAGHYFGLYHTFQGGCYNFNCLLNGDGVCDTPPDDSYIGFPCMGNSCTTELQDTTGLQPFTGDVDELPNYMDYSFCTLSFTQGQADRMEAVIQLQRSSLQLSNGCGNNPGQPASVAAFNFAVSDCNNGQVSFSDSASTQSISSEWDFNGDGIYEITGHDFTHQFPATGIYTVMMRTYGPGGCDSTTQTVAVQKGTGFHYPIVSLPQPTTDTIRACQGTILNFDGDPAGSNFLWSTGETTASISIVADSAMAVSLTMTDSTGFVWDTDCSPVYILVYPSDTPVITYDDTTGYTCQGDIITVYITNYNPGLYYWWVYHVSTGWFNTGSHDTSYSYIPDPANGSMFYVTYSNAAGCNSQSNTLLIQPQYTVYFTNQWLTVNGYTLSTPANGHQAQWYNWGVPIPGANGVSYTVTGTGCYSKEAWFPGYPACAVMSDTVCFTFTGTNEINYPQATVHPNPVRDQLNILLSQTVSTAVPVRICDLSGKLVLETMLKPTNGSNEAKVDVEALADGMYFLYLPFDPESTPVRFVKSGGRY
jgi:hypothetical protein